MLSFIQQMIFFAWYLIPTPFLKLTCGIYSGFIPRAFLGFSLKYRTNYDIPPNKHSSWLTSFVFIFKSRLQDVLIKTNIFSLLIHLQKRSTRCNMFVLVIRLQNVFETFPRRLQDLFKTRHFWDVLLRRLQDTFKTFLRPTAKTSLRRF